MSDAQSVHAAFAAVMAQVQAVRKDGFNSGQNFNFRGIDAVVNAVGPALREHGVIIVPVVEDSSHRDVTVGQRGTPMREVTLRVRYRVLGPAGDSFEGVVAAEALDAGDKATAKCMSVAFRTFLLQSLTIPTDEPDPDATSYERSAPQQERARLHPNALARFVTRCEDIGLHPEQVVELATDGRTMDPSQVFADEAQALRDAIAKLAEGGDQSPPAATPPSVPVAS